MTTDLNYNVVYFRIDDIAFFIDNVFSYSEGKILGIYLSLPIAKLHSKL